MKNRDHVLSDLGIVFFLVLTFVTITFTAQDADHYVQNLVMLNVTFLVILITYFSNITLGLVTNGVVIFFYISYTIFLVLVNGEPLTASSYFWIVLLPLYTYVVSLMTSRNQALQNRVNELEDENVSLSTVDPDTGLRNFRTLVSDAKIFIGMSKRGQIELSLMMIKFRHYKEIKRILGEERLPLFIRQMTEVLHRSLRAEDTLYLIEKEDIIFGLFLITDTAGTRIVEKRIRDHMKTEEFYTITAPYEVEIDLKIGVFHCDNCKNGEMVSPLEFIEKARKEMEYDVG
ncbi:diguanylate cyclase domain-containing protein [Acetobacterium wieringae]|uniref:Response regulator PleD n=1 Tax=Acetobacterium wieringae TaxID=52694 RepID=A0A1F2PIZ8_9FIRM|nr:GGDEF domain-containing protein [Acetobacterium wieringae]OFV71309.1 response regulator PleD [Acetobacterium wieringae]